MRGSTESDRVNRGPRRNLAFPRMLRSWVEQYFSDLVSLCRREEGDDIYGGDDTVQLNLEIGDRVFFLKFMIPKGPGVCCVPVIASAMSSRARWMNPRLPVFPTGLNVRCNYGSSTAGDVQDRVVNVMFRRLGGSSTLKTD